MNLRAVTMVARATTRRRWGQLVLLALLVALVGTVVLASLAGARRSSTALDRFQEATNARDGTLWSEEIDASDAVGVFGDVKGVTDAVSSQFYLAEVGTIGDFGISASLIPASRVLHRTPAETSDRSKPCPP